MKIRCLRTCIGVYQLPVVYGPQPTVNVENVNIRQTNAQPPPGDYKGTGVLRLTHFPIGWRGALIQMYKTRTLHNHGLTKDLTSRRPLPSLFLQ